MNPIQRALSFLGSWRPGVCRRFEWGQVEKEGCWQALLGKVLNSTRSRLNICFPDFLQSSSQQKENIIYSDSNMKSLYTPSSPQLQHHPPSPPKPITSTSQNLLEPDTSPLLYHCSSFLPASSVHGPHGTVYMHRNPTYLFKKHLPCLGGFMIPPHLQNSDPNEWALHPVQILNPLH